MAEVLKELSDSRYTVFDVLPAFFNHDDPMVRLGQWWLTADLIRIILISFLQLHSKFMLDVLTEHTLYFPSITKRVTP
jgi:hypothetical protein